jgi:hypothetical protein
MEPADGGRTVQVPLGHRFFFTELKQICHIHDFIGYSEGAVKWQVWIALLTHLLLLPLLRFMRHVSAWSLSFTRLAGIVRAALWVRRNLFEILALYGTADLPAPGKRSAGTPLKQGVFAFAAL